LSVTLIATEPKYYKLSDATPFGQTPLLRQNPNKAGGAPASDSSQQDVQLS